MVAHLCRLVNSANLRRELAGNYLSASIAHVRHSCLQLFFWGGGLYYLKEARICGMSQQKSSLKCFKNHKKGFLELSKWTFSLFCCIRGSLEQYVKGKIYVMKLPCFKSLRRFGFIEPAPTSTPPSNHWDWRTSEYDPDHKSLCCSQVPYNDSIKWITEEHLPLLEREIC